MADSGSAVARTVSNSSLDSASIDLQSNLPRPLYSDADFLDDSASKSSKTSKHSKNSAFSKHSKNSAFSKNSKTSRTSVSSSAQKVALSERRGIFSSLTLLPEYHDAKLYSTRRKYCIVLIVAFAAVTGPMGSSIMLPAIDNLAADLNTDVSTVNISVGIYLAALGVFPLWWSNFSERHGRRSVYVMSFIWFLAFSIGCALAPSISSLIVLRLLSGVGASAVQAVGAGTISDLFVQEKRGAALGVFYLGPLLGPFLSPILGGAVAEAWGWRACMWIIVILCGVNVFTILFFLPETLSRETLTLVKRQMEEEIDEYDHEDVPGEEAREDVDLEKQIDSENIPDKSGNKQDDKKEVDLGESLEGLAKSLSHPESEELQPPIIPNALKTSLSQNSVKSRTSVDSRRRRPSADLSVRLARLNSSTSRIVDSEIPIDPLFPTISRYTTNNSNSRRVSRYNSRIEDSDTDGEIPDTDLDTDPDVPEKNDSENANSQNLSGHSYPKATFLYDYIVRPTHSLVFLTYPPVLLTISYSALVFMGIYFFNISISNRYSAPPYNFSPVIVGLMYIPNSITYILASVYGGRWIDHLARKSAKLNNGIITPESRISWNVVVAVCLFLPGCMIFGWCMDKGEHWVTPLIGTAIYGFASMILIGCNVTYIIDLLPGKGATGIALNNLVRQVLAAVATFITEPLTTALGLGVLFSIYAGIITVTAVLVLYLKHRGPHLREKYDIADYYAKL